MAAGDVQQFVKELLAGPIVDLYAEVDDADDLDDDLKEEFTDILDRFMDDMNVAKAALHDLLTQREESSNVGFSSTTYY